MKSESDLSWSQIAVLILMTSHWSSQNPMQFMISIWIYIDYVPFMIAKSYHAFEAFSITIRSCSIDIVKTDVVFLK